MDRRFLAILAALVIIFIGIFSLTQNSNNSGGGNSNKAQSKTTHHVQGKGSKGVTLVEYGDYECPVCYVYYTVVKQVADKYKDDIYFQFSNLPLTSIHKNAFAAARSAEAAGMQNKYWEMHDLIYENQDPQGQAGWVVSNDPLSIFVGYAQQLGLNVTKFKQDYASEKVNDAINADVAAFTKTGQPMATPTFFLNGKYVSNNELVDSSGRPSVDAFSKVIDAAIAKKNTSK